MFRRQMSITASTYKKRFCFYKERAVLAVVERLFWQLGTHFSGRCRCREVVVVERFKQEVIGTLSRDDDDDDERRNLKNYLRVF